MDNAASNGKGPLPDTELPAPRRVDLGKGGDLLIAGSGERVLLLHGWGLHPPVFRRTLERLAHRGFEVAAPALAVVGRRWDLDRAVHRVERALDVLEWEDTIVVGYSLGGAVATAFAAVYPAHIRLLALVNSVGLRIDRGMLAWAAPIARYARTSNLPAMRAFGRNALRVRGLQNLADAATYARIAHLDAELARVREHRVPSVVLWGENDRLLPVAMGRRLAEALGAPIHVVPRADHDWPVRTPELFARELDLMLKATIAGGRRRRISGRRPARAGRRGTP